MLLQLLSLASAIAAAAVIGSCTLLSAAAHCGRLGGA